jgi:hypothetical protein
VEIIASSFEIDEPEIIVDENNYMEKVIEKIPALKNKYRKDGNLYVKISN